MTPTPRPLGRYMIQPDADLELAALEHPAGLYALLTMDSVPLIGSDYAILMALALMHDVDLWTPAGVPVGYRVSDLVGYVSLPADVLLARLEDLATKGLVIQRGDLFRPVVVEQ